MLSLGQKLGMESRKSQRENHLAREDKDKRIKRLMVATALKNSLRMTKDLSLKTPQPRSLEVLEEVRMREAQ